MSAAELAFPILLIDGEEGAIAAFYTDRDFRWFKALGLPLRRMSEVKIIDANLQLWRLDALSAIRFGGSWLDRINQFLSRRRAGTFEMTLIGSISWDEAQNLVCAEMERQARAFAGGDLSEGDVRDLAVWLASVKASRDVGELSLIVGAGRSEWGNWFSMQGRDNRVAYLLTIALVGAWFETFLSLYVWAGTDRNDSIWRVIGSVTITPLYYVLFAGAGRRLHDMDIAGGWLLPAIVLLAFVGGAVNGVTHSVVAAYLSVFVLLALLGIPRGTRGDNQFGPGLAKLEDQTA